MNVAMMLVVVFSLGHQRLDFLRLRGVTAAVRHAAVVERPAAAARADDLRVQTLFERIFRYGKIGSISGLGEHRGREAQQQHERRRRGRATSGDGNLAIAKAKVRSGSNTMPIPMAITAKPSQIQLTSGLT